jgi:hypothetical protein
MVAVPADAAIHGRRRSRFFVAMSGVLLLIVLTGFSRTFFLRAFFEVPAIPLHVYAHGAILTAWFVWFFLQTSLVAGGRSALHRKLGLVGALLGMAVIVANVMVLAALGPRLRVSLHAGEIDPDFIIRAVWGDFRSTLEFVVFLSAGLWFRLRPEIHKRLMFLASAAIIGPALGRMALWPAFGTIRSGILIGALIFFLSALIAHDYWAARRLNLATLFGGAFHILMWIGTTAIATSEMGEAIVRAMP